MTVTENTDRSNTDQAPSHPLRFTGRRALDLWVNALETDLRPDRVVWYDGTEDHWQALVGQMVSDGSLLPLDPIRRPNSFLARSDPGDVARVEDRTFICSELQIDAGPNNNWVAPAAMRAELKKLFDGAMRGRTMYVIPFSMGPIGGAISQVGVQVTDSPYAVVSMAIMTRTGLSALSKIGDRTPWTPAVHSVGAPLVDAGGARRADVAWPSNPTKVIAHFPDTREIWSFGSGYGGNALLAKKCFALRIASVMARDEGWLAEHMLLIRVTTPDARTYHVAAAFPSACGKTNFAMLSPTLPDWKVETLGDDIAWLRRGADGRLWAINPEAGFFGVAPGTSESTNPAAIATVSANTLFTNTALTDEGDVWWDGMSDVMPQHLIDWKGDDWTPDSGSPAAHPNSRFTVAATQCPTISADWDSNDGVPVDAIIFGGRRASNVPLVSEADDWTHGVFLGATISSEQTAAAEGPVGDLRFNPFAMQPFCGYNMADYWQHWLDVGDAIGPNAPRVFRVNWFKKGTDGQYIWPGFGDNIRVLKWIVERLEDEVDAESTPIGLLPYSTDLDLADLDLGDHAVRALLDVDAEAWLRESDLIAKHFARFGDRLPQRLASRLDVMRQHLRGYGR